MAADLVSATFSPRPHSRLALSMESANSITQSTTVSTREGECQSRCLLSRLVAESKGPQVSGSLRSRIPRSRLAFGSMSSVHHDMANGLAAEQMMDLETGPSVVAPSSRYGSKVCSCCG